VHAANANKKNRGNRNNQNRHRKNANQFKNTIRMVSSTNQQKTNKTTVKNIENGEQKPCSLTVFTKSKCEIFCTGTQRAFQTKDIKNAIVRRRSINEIKQQISP
jgi:hypothetical protein